jgi:hypothetical protein
MFREVLTDSNISLLGLKLVTAVFKCLYVTLCHSISRHRRFEGT